MNNLIWVRITNSQPAASVTPEQSLMLTVPVGTVLTGSIWGSTYGGWCRWWRCRGRRGAAAPSSPPPAGQTTTSTSPSPSLLPGGQYVRYGTRYGTYLPMPDLSWNSSMEKVGNFYIFLRIIFNFLKWLPSVNVKRPFFAWKSSECYLRIWIYSHGRTKLTSFQCNESRSETPLVRVCRFRKKYLT